MAWVKDNKKDLYFLTILLVMQLIYFLILARTRFVAADEAFYAIAAKQVLKGRLLYRDFFYPQMPLLPYLHGAWMKIFGLSWEQGRIFSALVAALIGLLTCCRIKAQVNRRAALLAAFLFVFSGMVIAWYSTFKTYGLTSFFLLLSYLFLVWALKVRKGLLFAFCGIFIGLAVNIRLFVVVTGLIPVFYIFRIDHTAGQKWHFLWCYLLGGLLTYLPHFFLMSADFDKYWFNNLGYHLIRSDLAGAEIYRQKGQIALELLGLTTSEEVFGFQFLGLVIFLLGYMSRELLKKRALDPAAYFALVLLIINFVPTPSWLQYFSTCIPFLLITCCLFLRPLYLQENGEGFSLAKYLEACVFVIVVFYYGLVGVCEITRYTMTGEGVIGVNTGNLQASRIETISQVSRELNQIAAEGEVVISQWPGYLFESHADIFPGMENQFWVRVADKLTEQDLEKYHLMSMKKLRTEIKEGQARILVLGRRKRALKKLKPEKYSFRVRASLPGVTIYSR